MVSAMGDGSAGRNEATTRLQIIDKLFFSCLGWLTDDVVLEESQGKEYADYVFSAPRRLLIVEAKREDDYFELPVGDNSVIRNIKPLMRDNENVSKAIIQVFTYCTRRGVPYACVCNGNQLIAFVASRNDSMAPLEGKCFVFASMQQMLDNFKELWDVLSKQGIEEKRLHAKLIGTQAVVLPPKLSTIVNRYPGSKNRNPFQADLQVLSELVIEDLPRSEAIEELFLRECYSQSGALSQYASISKSILRARYAALGKDDGPIPALVPAVDKQGASEELLSSSITRRPILLLGDVGVGKTSFLRNLMKVEAPDIFNNSISLYIDLGSEASLATELRNYILRAIIDQMSHDYKIDVFESSFVRGVYDLDLIKFQKSIYGELREVDPAAYRLKEMDLLQSKADDIPNHIKSSLRHVARGRRQQVIIIIDNSDQRDEQTQQSAFLIAQEIASQWEAIVFLPIRPETYNRSVKIGALSGYHPKAFTIPPPRIDVVVKKRIDFAMQIAEGEIPSVNLPEGVSVHLETISALLKTFRKSIDYNESIMDFIDNIAGGNVRLALDLVRGFFGSGHVDTRKIYEASPGYIVAIHEFMRAVIYGDHVYYDPSDSPVANLFDITSLDVKDHFLLPLLLELVSELSNASGGDGFVETSRVYDRLQGLGFVPDQIDPAMVRADESRLVELSSRSIPVAGTPMPKFTRITSNGKYHSKKLPSNLAYMQAILIDVPILDKETFDSIELDQDLDIRLTDTNKFRLYLDSCWDKAELNGLPFDWPTMSRALLEDIRRVADRLRGHPLRTPPGERKKSQALSIGRSGRPRGGDYRRNG